MKLKLDENLGSLRMVTRLRLAGYDVATVREQQLTATPDPQLIEICRREGRCLVTLDRGFGNRLRYNPADYPGIVILKLPNQPKLEDFREAVEILIAGLERSPVQGKLWIVQGGKIQEYQPIDPEEAD
jgi:predicted nuclease of predicted toxin-antitoxin system